MFVELFASTSSCIIWFFSLFNYDFTLFSPRWKYGFAFKYYFNAIISELGALAIIFQLFYHVVATEYFLFWFFRILLRTITLMLARGQVKSPWWGRIQMEPANQKTAHTPSVSTTTLPDKAWFYLPFGLASPAVLVWFYSYIWCPKPGRSCKPLPTVG